MVTVLIAAASLLFLLTATVLYYHWATTRDPSGVIIVNAGEQLRGAEVIVDGPLLSEPLKGTVGDKNRFSLPFYVDAGTYSISIRFGEQMLYDRDISVGPRTGYRIDLTRFQVPATSPAPILSHGTSLRSPVDAPQRL